MSSFALTLINMSSAASIVIIAIIIARFIIKKAPKRFSYILWIAAAFRLLCPVSIRSAISLFRFIPASTAPEKAGQLSSSLDYASTIFQKIGERVSGTVTAPPVHPTGSLSNAVTTTVPGAFTTALPNAAATVIPQANTATGTVITTAPPVVSGTVAQASVDPSQVLLTLISVIWLTGFLVLIVYGVVGYIKAKRKLSTATRFEGNVFCSENVLSPFILGFVKPRIYIPYKLSGKQLDYVLAHERCHLKRRDYIINAFAFVLLAMHWFNPLCWLAYYLMTRDMEMSCDEKVLASNSGIGIEYSETLLSFAIKKQFPQPSPLAFGESSVKGRIKNAMKFKKPKFIITILVFIICVVIVAACAVNPLSGTTAKPSTTSSTSINDSRAKSINLGMPEAGESFYAIGESYFAISSNDELYGWGDNHALLLGTPDSKIVYSPIKILANVHKLVTHVYGTHCGAIDKNGALWIWGSESVKSSIVLSSDEASLDNAFVFSAPERVLENVYDAYLGVNESYYYTTLSLLNNYALCQDGTVWGWNDGDEPKKLYDGVVEIKATGNTMHFLKSDGSLWGFGGGDGLLGDANMLDRSEPVKIFDNVKFFGKHYAIMADGTLYGWGPTFNPSDISMPRKIADNVMSIQSMNDSMCLFLKNDKSLWSIGNMTDLESLADDTAAQHEPVHLIDNVVSAEIYDQDVDYLFNIGPNHHYAAFALTESGELYSWGNNISGVLGKPDVDAETVSPPSVVETDVASFTSDGFSTFIVKTDGTLYACGSNGGNGNGYDRFSQGRLGDGTRETRRKFVKIMDSVKTVYHSPIWKMIGTDVETGGEDWMINYTRTFALSKNGTIYTWGLTDYPYVDSWIYTGENDYQSASDSPIVILEGAKVK